MFKKSTPSSPEEKKIKIIVDKMVETVSVDKNLFKNDESWKIYQNQLRLLDGYMTGVLEENEKLMKEKDGVIEELTVETKAMEKIKEQSKVITFCNLYRKQLEYYETVFSKEEVYGLFPNFAEMVKISVSVFNYERKEKKLDTLLLQPNDKMNLFFQTSLTRVEKWRIIILWLIIDEVSEWEEGDTCSDEIRKLMKEVKTSICQIKLSNRRPEFWFIRNSSRFEGINLLRERFFEVIKIGCMNDLYKLILFEIKGIAVGFDEAYQRCSKEMKRFEIFSACPEQYVAPSKLVPDDLETEDDCFINTCLNLFVNLGKDLARYGNRHYN